MDRVTTPFSATTTAAEVLAGVDLRGREVLVTGGASGIGRETARALAVAGARVTIAVRDVEAGARAAQDIRASGGAGVAVAHLDLLDLASVDALAAGWQRPLHALVDNAAVMGTPLVRTPQGWELQFATNHLGHFRLALGLHDALAAAGDARVVSVSSSGHGASPVVFDDLFFRDRAYDPGLAYGQSKTANVLFAVEAARRWQPDGITANAVMPGGIWTALQRHWDPELLARTRAEVPTVDSVGPAGVKTPQQGAATSVLAAASPLLRGVTGTYLEDCQQAEVVERIPDGLHGVLPHALDPAAAARLWDVSLDLLARARPQSSSSPSASSTASVKPFA